MEENTFLSANPQYNNPIGENLENHGYQNQTYLQPRNSGLDADVFKRWFNPGLAEAAQFDRENFMLDKENAFSEYMFNKTNEWNSASAQMERGMAAGINPMLLAAGIAGSGASASPVQGGAGTAAMNNQSSSPMDFVNGAFDLGTKAIGGAETLGKLFGFGKENKANLKVLEKTADKLEQDANLTKLQGTQIKKTLKAFVKKWNADANYAEKAVENIQALTDKYKAEKELTEKTTEFTEEQTETQKELTKTQRYKNWEEQFKKAFRELFGVQLNDSDYSMLAQLCLNGKGHLIIDALSDLLVNVNDRIEDNFWNTFAKGGEETTQKIRDWWIKKKYLRRWNKLTSKQKGIYNDDFNNFMEFEMANGR